MTVNETGKSSIYNLKLILLILQLTFIDIPCAIWEYFTRKRKEVKGQVVVISGGAQGIGKEMARMFALQHRAKVAILDVQEKVNELTAAEIVEDGGRAFAFRCDVTDPENCRQIASTITSHPELGAPDIVISNAGVLVVKELTESTDKEIKRTIDINVLGVFWLIRAFLPRMKESNHGQVVAVSSIAGHVGQHLSPDYCASKFAVRGLMESLSEELRANRLSGVKTTTVYPFFVNTPLVNGCKIHSEYFAVSEPHESAECIVDAILKEKEESFVPSLNHRFFCTILKAYLPGRGLRRFRDFVDIRYK